MAEVVGTIRVCVDCMFVAVNGETGGEPDREPWGELPTADVAPDFDSETGEGFEEFSWRACDGCGSQLGGSRYEFAVFAWERSE